MSAHLRNIMGTDIHTVAERQVDGAFRPIEGLTPFDWRSYGLFGFLADVRNHSSAPAISPPRGLPIDASPEAREGAEWGHSSSWLSLEEILAVDYDAPFEDRRVMRQIGPNHYSGAVTAPRGEGEMTTLRAFLGEAFFDDLAQLRAKGADRIVFWFDN